MQINTAAVATVAASLSFNLFVNVPSEFSEIKLIGNSALFFLFCGAKIDDARRHRVWDSTRRDDKREKSIRKKNIYKFGVCKCVCVTHTQCDSLFGFPRGNKQKQKIENRDILQMKLIVLMFAVGWMRNVCAANENESGKGVHWKLNSLNFFGVFFFSQLLHGYMSSFTCNDLIQFRQRASSSFFIVPWMGG